MRPIPPEYNTVKNGIKVTASESLEVSGWSAYTRGWTYRYQSGLERLQGTSAYAIAFVWCECILDNTLDSLMRFRMAKARFATGAKMKAPTRGEKY